MGTRRTLAKTDHTAMLDAFRADAPHYRPAKVAKQCRVDPKTAHRAWSTGWPKRDWAPIAETLEAEKQKARALLHEHRATQQIEADHERDAAIADAAKQVASETQMVRIAQKASLDGLGAVAAISTQARTLGVLIAEQVDADCKRVKDDPYKLSAAQGLSLLDRIAKTTKVLLENGRQAMEMERLRLGRPLAPDAEERLGEMTVEEADLRVESATAAVAAAKQSGGLRIVDGGKMEPTIGKRVGLI